jgi:hypothetical protein
VNTSLVEISSNQLMVIARCPWMKELHSSLRAAGLYSGYTEGTFSFFGRFGGNLTIDIPLGNTGYPMLSLVFSEENLPELPQGYVAEFILQRGETDFVPFGPTRIGLSVMGIQKHFDNLHPPHFVEHLGAHI